MVRSRLRPTGVAAGGNGVYSYGPGSSFPSAVFYATNYWVDIAFVLSTASLFNPSDTPVNVTWDDPNPVELGVRFQSSVAGFVTGVRFYKGPQNVGNHVGNLWSSDGTLLASATFTGETETGWQVAAFTNPVPIASNTIYVVSYHTDGFYSADLGYFTSDHSNGPLLAPASGGNGVYARGTTSSFPSASFGRDQLLGRFDLSLCSFRAVPRRSPALLIVPVFRAAPWIHSTTLLVQSKIWRSVNANIINKQTSLGSGYRLWTALHRALNSPSHKAGGWLLGTWPFSIVPPRRCKSGYSPG